MKPNPPNRHVGYTYSGARCQCICHRQAGIKHFMACCSPRKPAQAMSAGTAKTEGLGGDSPASAVREDAPETVSGGSND